MLGTKRGSFARTVLPLTAEPSVQSEFAYLNTKSIVVYLWTLQWEGWVSNTDWNCDWLSAALLQFALCTQVGFSLLVLFFGQTMLFLMSVFLWHGNIWRRLEDSLPKLALYFLIGYGDRTQIINLGCRCPWFIILLVPSSWIYCVLSNKQVTQNRLTYWFLYWPVSRDVLCWGSPVDSTQYYILLRGIDLLLDKTVYMITL